MNSFIYYCLAFLFLILQTSALDLFIPSAISPDLLSVLVVYIAMTRKFRQGLIFVLFSSYVFSLHTSINFFIFSLFYIVAYSVARYISLNFYTNDLKYLFLSISIPVFFSKITMLFWLGINTFSLFFEHFFYIIVCTILTSATGIVLFRFFNWIDIVTKKINIESVVEE